MGAGAFMLHRIVRLYPLYLLGIVLGFVVLCRDDGWAMPMAATRGLRYVAAAGAAAVHAAGAAAAGQPGSLFAERAGVDAAVRAVRQFRLCAAFRWLRDTRVLALLVAGLRGWRWSSPCFSVRQDRCGARTGRRSGRDLRAAGFGFFAGVLTFRLMGAPRATRRPVSNWAFVLLFAIPVACFIPATAGAAAVRRSDAGGGVGHAAVVAVPEHGAAAALSCAVHRGRADFVRALHPSPALPRAGRADQLAIAACCSRSGRWAGSLILVMAVGLAYVAERYYDRPVRRWIVARLKRRRRASGRSSARLPSHDASSRR